jgi:3-hydroxyacyl-CoA dehydrogenase
MNRPINRIAVIGTGVIGASWAALFLAKGRKVAATDPAPEPRRHCSITSGPPGLRSSNWG